MNALLVGAALLTLALMTIQRRREKGVGQGIHAGRYAGWELRSFQSWAKERVSKLNYQPLLPDWAITFGQEVTHPYRECALVPVIAGLATISEWVTRIRDGGEAVTDLRNLPEPPSRSLLYSSLRNLLEPIRSMDEQDRRETSTRLAQELRPVLSATFASLISDDEPARKLELAKLAYETIVVKLGGGTTTSDLL